MKPQQIAVSRDLLDALATSAPHAMQRRDPCLGSANPTAPTKVTWECRADCPPCQAHIALATNPKGSRGARTI